MFAPASRTFLFLALALLVGVSSSAFTAFLLVGADASGMAVFVAVVALYESALSVVYLAFIPYRSDINSRFD